jgi:hypothetical protein
MLAVAPASVLIAQAGTASVVLPKSATTSAGVYDSEDRLVRTLWGGRFSPAGTITLRWDGLDDDGLAVSAAGQYRARVLTHNVRYIWEGVIGNTSKDFTGDHVYRAFNPINDMAIDSKGHAFYVVGYNEQQNGLHRFDTSDPQEQTALAHDDYRRVFRYAATDGALAYFANVGLPAPRGSFAREPSTFVIALNVADNSEYRFSHGRVDMPGGNWGNRWGSVIDYDHDDVDADGAFRAAASGMAVQQHGNELFVAHRQLDEVRVLDKREGTFLDRIAVSSPSDLAVAADDSLWVLCRIAGQPAVVHYLHQAAHWVAAEQVITGLQQPAAIAISPLDGALVVADAGSEQLKAFDAHGNSLWTYGRRDAYRDGHPEVRDDKLWLSAGATYIAFQPDGSFWVGDPGNARNLHLSAQRRYLGQIMYLPASYHVAVDPANPTRVFNRFLEFSVDYSLPLHDSWRLVRNWAAGLGKMYLGDLDGLLSVVTLSNGRTYGVLPRYDSKKSEIVELTEAGLRPTGTQLELGVKLYPDGSLRGQVLRFLALEVYISKLAGFDESGQPRWDEPEPLAEIATVKPNDPYYHDVPLGRGVNEATFPETGGGVLVFFNPSVGVGFHLGGARIGAHNWLWRASPSGSWSLDSSGQILSPDGSYEIKRGVHYPGNVVVTSGRQIIYGYHGEAWNGGQADQWVHFLDNGLFVGQFGRPVYPAANKVSAQAESAGNTFSPQLVTVNGRLYLWHNDEGVHGGVHRWRIDGTDDISFLEVAIEP